LSRSTIQTGDAGVGVLASLDDVIETPGTREDDLHDDQHVRRAEQSAVAVHPVERPSIDYHQVGSAHQAGLIRGKAPQIDINVLDDAHTLRELRDQLHRQREPCHIVLRGGAGRHQDAAFHEFGVTPPGLTERGVLRSGQQTARGQAGYA